MKRKDTNPNQPLTNFLHGEPSSFSFFEKPFGSLANSYKSTLKRIVAII